MRRLFILFIALFLITGVSFSQKREPGKVKTLVIDPGHGGDKPGALGKHSKEKELTLAIAKKFGKLVQDNYPDVKVIFTRTTDVDVTLSERANIANRAKADLFVSIHCNSHPTTTPTGMETYVMGLSRSRANMEVAKKENADILLEDGYKNNKDYQGFDPNSPESYVMFAMYQNAYIDKSLNFAQYAQEQYKSAIKTVNRGVKQAEFFVIYKTAMPAVLTEVGFISNPAEEAFMMSEEGQATIAVCLLNAFANYKAHEEATAKPVKMQVDLPGYGKNKDTKKAVTDSSANATQKQDDALATAILESKGEEAPKAHVEAPASSRKENLSGTVQINQEEAELQVTVQKDQTIVEGVTFRVQFLTSEKEIPTGAKDFKGVSGYQVYQQDGLYRYTMGNETTIAKAKNIQSELRKKGFQDAFVIAFYNGKRISLQEARELQEQQ
ncbi:MAG: N-acetylmuramoyl-L-alanine amidase [Bacteroidales bacterium]|jgi:N-acetylmuramoyl-L-alanine amidase|nr:N-acetylmuramoyl-L-alanine amidase [Bacteroidales bacterium]